MIKDAGDDIDVTHRALIIARVRRQREPGVTIEGGRGVGRVTRPGLDQPPGAAAINRGPRRQIAQAVQAECRAAGAAGGMHVLIEIPEGERLARKTFNPKLGIVGGLSVLGTGGIVHPRSRRAVRETVTLEIGQAAALGAGRLALCPGNVGRDFARRVPGLKHWPTVVCSNFVGAAVDAAAEGGIPTLLLTGSLGKLIKVAGGSWDTHSASPAGGWRRWPRWRRRPGPGGGRCAPCSPAPPRTRGSPGSPPRCGGGRWPSSSPGWTVTCAPGRGTGAPSARWCAPGAGPGWAHPRGQNHTGKAGGSMKGICFAVSVGPGDPGLMTIGAARCIERLPGGGRAPDRGGAAAGPVHRGGGGGPDG